jgi:hypothetical protein
MFLLSGFGTSRSIDRDSGKTRIVDLLFYVFFCSDLIRAHERERSLNLNRQCVCLVLLELGSLGPLFLG